MVISYGLAPPSPTHNVSGLLQAFLFVNICQDLRLYLFGKTSKRRGTQFHVGKLSIYVLSSRLDPTGDQNDAQYLQTYGVCLIHLVLYLPNYHMIHNVPTAQIQKVP